MTSSDAFPTGWVARCRCGVITGAADRIRSDREVMGKMLGVWLIEGKTIEPRYGKWNEMLGSCVCKNAEGCAES